MATNEIDANTDVPTLRNVVTAGDETVIQSKRIGQQLEDEMGENLGTSLSQEIIRSMTSRSVDPAPHPPIHELTGDWNTPPQGAASDHIFSASETQQAPAMDDTLELLIDDIIDRHITALRQDIRLLLERALAER